jgi:hypothetical protein
MLSTNRLSRNTNTRPGALFLRIVFVPFFLANFMPTELVPAPNPHDKRASKIAVTTSLVHAELAEKALVDKPDIGFRLPLKAQSVLMANRPSFDEIMRSKSSTGVNFGMADMHCDANLTYAFGCIKIFATYLSPQLLTFTEGLGAAVKIPVVIQKGDGPGDSVRSGSIFSPASSDDSTPLTIASKVTTGAQVRSPPRRRY